MENYFLALVPEEEIYSKVKYSKKSILKKYGDQTYLRDSPHLTLYLFKTENIEIIWDQVKKLNLTNVSLEVKDWLEFPKDPVTGAYTLALRFNENNVSNLKEIQSQIVTKVNEFRTKEIPDRYKDLTFQNDIFNKNVLEYGYPFIGDIWIPHISFCSFSTLTSINEFRDSTQLKEFQKQSFFDKIILCKLDHNGDYNIIKTLNLVK